MRNAHRPLSLSFPLLQSVQRTWRSHRHLGPLKGRRKLTWQPAIRSLYRVHVRIAFECVGHPAPRPA